MKEITLCVYECEICGSQSEKKSDVEKCEKSHVRVSEIIYEHFPRGFGSREKSYPKAIRVKMQDGTEFDYHIGSL